MRFIAVLAAAAPLALGVPIAQAKTIEAICGTNAETSSFLFWPKGHNARPGAGFPAFKTPHVEVYGGKHTTSFPNSAQLAYLDSKGTAAVAKSCHANAATFSKRAVVGTKRTSAANVICAFGEPVTYRLGKVTGGARIQVVLGSGAVALDLTIRKSGSKVAFSSLCKAHAPPS